MLLLWWLLLLRRLQRLLHWLRLRLLLRWPWKVRKRLLWLWGLELWQQMGRDLRVLLMWWLGRGPCRGGGFTRTRRSWRGLSRRAIRPAPCWRFGLSWRPSPTVSRRRASVPWCGGFG